MAIIDDVTAAMLQLVGLARPAQHVENPADARTLRSSRTWQGHHRDSSKVYPAGWRKGVGRPSDPAGGLSRRVRQSSPGQLRLQAEIETGEVLEVIGKHAGKLKNDTHASASPLHNQIAPSVHLARALQNGKTSGSGSSISRTPAIPGGTAADRPV